MVKQRARESSIEHKLEVAKARVKEGMRSRLSDRTAKPDQKVGLRFSGDHQWKKKPEEIVRGETTGELALQKDFVPF